jgi:hypothetical protein
MGDWGYRPLAKFVEVYAQEIALHCQKNAVRDRQTGK